MPDKQPVIVDFDKFETQRRIAKICGEEIDVTRIPTRSTLALAQFSDDMTAGKYSNEESFMKLVELIATIARPLCPELTADKLLDKTTYASLKAFLDFVVAPLTEEAEEGNAETAK